MNDVKTTPRAVKLTADALPMITAGQGVKFDLPPNPDDLLDAITMPGNIEYYFVTECPGVTSSMPISWALVPDFVFNRRFRFATKPSATRLISIIEKED